MAKLSRAQIIVSGVVQGVGYRFFAEREARRRGLVGYCRNIYSGDVEVVVEGDSGLMNDYIKDLRRGPFSASVTNVNVQWAEYKGEFSSFDVEFY